MNYEELRTKAQGLRGTSYPGKPDQIINRPPKGLGLAEPEAGEVIEVATPLGLNNEQRYFHAPRVAPPTDQPWALGRSPVGAEERTKTH
jgi:hypothetical protein